MLCEEKQWVQGLKKIGILRLLDVPHFGRSLEINARVKKLINTMHGGNLWSDVKVDISTQLISMITGFPIKGEDLEWLFTKESEKNIAPKLYEKYQTTWGIMGIVISQINDDMVKFVAQIMHHKLLRKCRRDQFSTGALTAVEMCVVLSLGF